MQTRVLFPSALFFIILFLYFFYLNGNPHVFPLDDAYIHFVYAQNLASGQGLCFNTGETSFGTSSPLWVILLALCKKSGIDLYVAALMLSFFSYLFSAILVFFICGEIIEFRGRSLYSFTAALLYVSSGNMTWLSLSGMETPLFQMLCLLSVYLFLKKGYCFATALTAGLVVLCRLTGIFLVIPLFAVSFLEEKKIRPAFICTFFIVFPYYLYQRIITGSFFPVTAGGKTLTYVAHGWNITDILSYLTAVFKYLFLYEQLFFVVLIVAVPWAVISAFKKSKTVKNNAGLIILCLWAGLHMAVHALMFRTLNQNFRYLAVLFPVLSILAAYFTGCVVRSRLFSSIIMFILVLFSFSNQTFWKELYGNNLRHIETVYVRCADWINKNTADTAIAAFDIGIIKFFTGRYVVDLGGVTDRFIHPYLAAHEAGRFIRKKGVSLIVYSRFPDCDIWPGIYRSAYDREGLMKETHLVSFKVPYYKVPSITHSFELDVSRVNKWVLPTISALEDFFYVEHAPGKGQGIKKFENNLELVAVEPGRRTIKVTKNMSQHICLTYYWRAVEKIMKKPVIKTRLINSRSGKVIMDKDHIPTHNLLQPELWEPGKIVRERHVVWIPDNSPPGIYEIRISCENKDGGIKGNEFVIEPSILQILY